MKDTKVYLLDGGSMVLDRSYLFLDAGLTGDQRFPVYGVLVDHADGKFLFDTGFDLEHTCKTVPFTQPLQTERQTIPGQLDLLDLRPSDVTHVINSHYHIDHIGGNRHCKRATTVCHRCEIEAFRFPTEHEALGYSDTRATAHLRDVRPSAREEDAAYRAAEVGAKVRAAEFDLYTPRIETLTGDQEIAKGVYLFETIGHTAGHYSLMVQLAHRRPMLFTADACYSKQSMDMMCIQAGNRDNSLARASMQRLKDLARHYDAELFYSHDPDSYASYQKAPYAYL
jgi:4-pyridoxolactonase